MFFLYGEMSQFGEFLFLEKKKPYEKFVIFKDVHHVLNRKS
jgi:hypothetical protein